MDPMTAIALGQVGGSVLGGLFGGGDRKRAMKALQDLKEEAGPSAFAGIEGDAQARDVQMRALESLYSQGRAGGMDQASRARLMQAQNSIAAQNRGAQGQIAQQYAMRGQSGGGAELAARFAAQQGGANAAAMAGTQAAGDANMRALQALQGAGGLAGNARAQTWGERSDKAGAQDAMARFNAQQRLQKGGMMYGAYNSQAQNTASMGAGLGGAVGGVVSMFGDKKKGAP